MSSIGVEILMDLTADRNREYIVVWSHICDIATSSYMVAEGSILITPNSEKLVLHVFFF